MRRAMLAALAMALAGCAPPADPSGSSTGAARLPVEGRWRVHRTHYDHPTDQATAVDLIADAPLPTGRGQPNEAYASYGRAVVADGDGRIAIVVDGVPDNRPGIVNAYDAHGNFVVVEHPGGAHSLYAHLSPGSIAVAVGQRVQAGERLGACGNSGRSTMPHLHWQRMDRAEAHLARALPIQHAPYLRNGRRSTARLEAGDVVEALD